ncbi:TolC family protein [Arsenicitalea aurantiaca]|uniref:TolC family protein n=1 Tax=Arsenicitalea aurantiaca TaxID=1783274 RepID=A0A433X887_9HYPH|nr:TolC family protein [Arsenicitalea aurantiaca]RUT30258.1 TolC family protein [Arsenicitalea aurantiaca]
MASARGFALSLLAAALLAGCGHQTGLISAQAVNGDLARWNASVAEQGVRMNASTSDQVMALAADQEALRAQNASAVSLGTLYANGIANNYHIRIAQRQTDVADAELVNAAMRFFPRLSGTVSAVRTNQNILDSDNEVFEQGRAVYNTYNAALEAKVPILDLEILFNYRKTEVAQRKSYVEYIGTAQMFIRDLIGAYIDIAEANAVIAEYEERLRLVGNRAHVERQLQAAGSGRPEVTLSFEQQVSDMQGQLVDHKARRQMAMSRIYELTGMNVGAVSGQVRVADVVLPANQLHDLRTLALRNNVQYLAKQYELDMFTEELYRASAADFGPRLNAFGTYEYEDRGGSQFGGGSTTVQGVAGIELKVPIFNAEGNGYQSLPARARHAKVVEELALTRREIDTMLTRAHANYDAARQRLAMDQRTLARGQDIIYLINRRIAEANAVNTEGLQTRLEQAAYERQRQQTQFQMLREWLTIKYLVGGLSEADIALFSGGA